MKIAVLPGDGIDPEIELYLAARGSGLPLEVPGVRR